MARLITIEGPGGSGKTTLGERLAMLAGFRFYDLDNFVHKTDPKYLGTLDEALDSIKTDLRKGKDVVVPYWSFKNGSAREFSPKLDSLEGELDMARVPIMIASPLSVCLYGDQNREKTLGEEHIRRAWNLAYQGLTDRHVVIPNGDFKGLERISRYLRSVQ